MELLLQLVEILAVHAFQLLLSFLLMALSLTAIHLIFLHLFVDPSQQYFVIPTPQEPSSQSN